MLSVLALLPMGMPKGDWLVDDRPFAAHVSFAPKSVTLSNGLISRTIILGPDAATVSLANLGTGEEMVRAVKPEGLLTVNGKEIRIGGLLGQPNLAYLRTEWIAQMKADPEALHFERVDSGKTVVRMEWGHTIPSEGRPWPPPGVSVRLHFSNAAGLRVAVCYELYDGMPTYAKWLEIENQTGSAVQLNSFTSEYLGLAEAESIVDANDRWLLPNISVFTDYQFGGMALNNSNRTIHWETDPAYGTQVNYDLKTPCDLHVRPPLGPDVTIPSGQKFLSFRTFVLLHDSSDRERKGMAVRRAYRVLAPWSTESPLMLHLTSSEPVTVRSAIDQAAECGFEMIILSFGSGLNMEDTSEANIAKFRGYRDYAHSKGLRLGGYSLLASRRISEEDDVINPKTGHTGGAIFGNSPCLGSNWGIAYFEHLKMFLEKTGFDLLEHDGSYPGDVCASTTHPGHTGLEDSQWKQYQQIQDLYHWARAKGIYLNVPDHYFFAGSNKTGMGYRETNWSLPRAEQHIHARMNLFDGTWEKAPTMGWMMTPLVEYQGGGAGATIEPLHEHIDDYERHLVNNLGFGVQSCYRGPRLYDSPEVKAMVVKQVSWFKKHRAILESDIIHLRRADARNWDGVLHVNPSLPEKAMLVAFNPRTEAITQKILVPLYYSGLKGKASAQIGTSAPITLKLDAQQRVEMEIEIPAQGMTWIVFR